MCALGNFTSPQTMCRCISGFLLKRKKKANHTDTATGNSHSQASHLARTFCKCKGLKRMLIGSNRQPIVSESEWWMRCSNKKRNINPAKKKETHQKRKNKNTIKDHFELVSLFRWLLASRNVVRIHTQRMEKKLLLGSYIRNYYYFFKNTFFDDLYGNLNSK